MSSVAWRVAAAAAVGVTVASGAVVAQRVPATESVLQARQRCFPPRDYGSN